MGIRLPGIRNADVIGGEIRNWDAPTIPCATVLLLMIMMIIFYICMVYCHDKVG